jgi:hypothetical protein
MGKTQSFFKTATATDFNCGTTATDLAVVASKWNLIGYMQVPAQQLITYGAGAIANGVDSRQYVKIRMDSASGQLTGTYRLVITDGNKANSRFIAEERSERTSTGTDFKLGSQSGIATAKEDSYLEIYFMPDSSSTIDYSDADNIVLMPLTITIL